MPDDRFPVTWSGRSATVVVPAELDLTISDGLRETLLGALNAGALGLVVDMSADIDKIFIPSGPSLLPRGTTAGPSLAVRK